MSNTILTPTAVTREGLRILHQKLNFVGSINREYDDSYAKKGAKIGSTLKIREPNQFVVRSGRTMNAQDVTEASQTLTVATQKGVDVNFGSDELTLSLDDFGKRILDPMMAVLAANIEYDAMLMFKDVWNSVYDNGNAIVYNDVLDGRTLMQRGLAPMSSRTANMNSTDMADLVKDTKTLFQDAPSISKQYREGFMGHVAGFDFMENTMWPGFTQGAANTSYVCNTSTGITSGTATITVTTGSGAFVVGDVITVAGVYSVHPETKVSTGVLQQFVVTTASAGGSVTLDVSPTPYTSGPKQNITIVSAGASKAVVVGGGTASADYTTSLLYQKDAFTFVTADLIIDPSMGWAAREVVDGISMRVWKQADITNDNIPCRIDVLYGYKTLRPQWATRLHFN